MFLDLREGFLVFTLRYYTTLHQNSVQLCVKIWSASPQNSVQMPWTPVWAFILAIKLMPLDLCFSLSDGCEICKNLSKNPLANRLGRCSCFTSVNWYLFTKAKNPCSFQSDQSAWWEGRQNLTYDEWQLQCFCDRAKDLNQSRSQYPCPHQHQHILVFKVLKVDQYDFLWVKIAHKHRHRPYKERSNTRGQRWGKSVPTINLWKMFNV